MNVGNARARVMVISANVWSVCTASVAVLLLVLLSAGCVNTWVDFKPYSTATLGRQPVLQTTILAYEGDIEALALAGAEIVGVLQVRGNGFASPYHIRRRALHEAARLGATHILLGNERSIVSWVQITPDRATTRISGNRATTTYQPGAQMPVTNHSGSFVLVRVPPEHWIQLPEGLRPVPGRHLSGELPPQATTHAGSSAAPPERASWYCTSGQRVAAGMCFRTEMECRELRERLAAHRYSPCRGSASAFCFSFESEEGTRLLCHPTIESCQAQRDYAFSQGQEIRRECSISQ